MSEKIGANRLHQPDMFFSLSRLKVGVSFFLLD